MLLLIKMDSNGQLNSGARTVNVQFVENLNVNCCNSTGITIKI